MFPVYLILSDHTDEISLLWLSRTEFMLSSAAKTTEVSMVL